MRGSNLTRDSLIARWTMAFSNSARGAFFGRTARAGSGVESVRGTAMGSCCFSVIMGATSQTKREEIGLMSRQREHLVVLDDGPEGEAWEVGERADNQHHTDEKACK